RPSLSGEACGGFHATSGGSSCHLLLWPLAKGARCALKPTTDSSSFFLPEGGSLTPVRDSPCTPRLRSVSSYGNIRAVTTARSLNKSLQNLSLTEESGSSVAFSPGNLSTSSSASSTLGSPENEEYILSFETIDKMRRVSSYSALNSLIGECGALALLSAPTHLRGTRARPRCSPDGGRRDRLGRRRGVSRGAGVSSVCRAAGSFRHLRCALTMADGPFWARCVGRLPEPSVCRHTQRHGPFAVPSLISPRETSCLSRPGQSRGRHTSTRQSDGPTHTRPTHTEVFPPHGVVGIRLVPPVRLSVFGALAARAAPAWRASPAPAAMPRMVSQALAGALFHVEKCFTRKLGDINITPHHARFTPDLRNHRQSCSPRARPPVSWLFVRKPPKRSRRLVRAPDYV
uniref:uncharacterized protein LOC132674276 n=1 Tax=Panthera onca TaxID=9690 RepID=UPI002953EC26